MRVGEYRGLGQVSPWDHASPEARRAHQGAALRSFVRDHVLPFSPFYRTRLSEAGIGPDAIRGIDDLSKIPFTTKADLLATPERPEAPRDFILAPTPELLRRHLPLARKLRLLSARLFGSPEAAKRLVLDEYAPETLIVTTGRSAGSVPLFLTPHDRRRLREAGRRICGHLDLVAGRDRTLSLFPYAPHLAFWQVAACGEGAGVLTLNTGGGRTIPVPRLLDLVGTFRPTCIAGMPGFTAHLLRRAAEEGRDWSSVRVLTLGGENVPQGLDAKLADFLAAVGASHAKVLSVLGFTEARTCWTECIGGRHGFHTNPDMEILEIVDPETGKPLPEGRTGELVYTCLDGRGSVLLRYRTGDVVEGGLIESEPCPGCGSRVPRIRSSIARTSNVRELHVTKVKGTLVNLNALSDLFASDASIEEWQLEIRKRDDRAIDVDELVLRVARRGDETQADFESRLQRAVFAIAELHVNRIEVLTLDALIRLLGTETLTKEDRLVDRRPDAR